MRGNPFVRYSVSPLVRTTAIGVVLVMAASSAAAEQRVGGRSITDTSIHWPTWAQGERVLLLRDYNTRVVVLGTAMLGLAAGTIGSFLLLRKRALMGDALSHATLPGIGAAFMLSTAMGGAGKSLPALLTGAVATGAIGVGCVLLVRGVTRLKEDAVLGIVLSVFFGAGIVLLGIIQKMETGSAAGLESFIYGKTASMLAADAWRIVAAAAAVIVVCSLLYKEFKLLCFDPGYAAGQGWPVTLLDVAMMALAVAVTVIGLQAVGLILVIALLIIPAAAARFWTHRFLPMTVGAAGVGAASAMTGAGLSALFPRLPSGAMIVVAAAAAFALSMIFAPARGVLARWWRHHALVRRIARQHVLRAMYERSEAASREQGGRAPVALGDLQAARSWSPRELRSALASARRDGLVRTLDADRYALTEHGLADARRVTRNHRLWELYLITHADVAPSHVDRDAEQVEHVLGPAMVAELETLLAREAPEPAIPPSPHRQVAEGAR